MAMATLEKNYLRVSGKKYFTTNAENVKIGSYGDKRTPIGKPNYMQVWKDMDVSKLEIEEATVIDLNTKKSKKRDVEAKVGKKGLAGVGAKNVYDKFASGELKLAKLIVRSGDMVDEINSDSKVLEYLQGAGRRARFCAEVFVVITAKMAEKVENTNSFDVSASKGSVDVELKGSFSSGHDNTLEISEGTMFAYSLLKPVWTGRGKKKGNIKRVRPDTYGAA